MLWALLLWAAAGLTQCKDLLDLTGRDVADLDGFELRNYGFAPPYSPNLHWTIGGFAMVTPQRVTLTRDLPSVYGAVWNKNPVQMRDWQAVITFRVETKSAVPADGLAFWYTSTGGGTGRAYGAPHHFSGIGVALDTYSNRHPGAAEKIAVLFNRGDKEYVADDDGAGLGFSDGEENGQISCSMSKEKVQTLPHENIGETVKILVRYFEETLTVYYAGFYESQWKRCGKYDGLHLPLGYYFGVSAATGDLHSAHHLTSLRVFELHGEHKMAALGVPSSFGPMEELNGVDAHRNAASSSSSSAFWSAFKFAAFSAFFAVCALLLYLGWKEYAGGQTRRNKFY